MLRRDPFFKTLALAITGGTLAANAWHILVNQAPPSWDDGWYLENSFRFFEALGRGPWDFAVEYAGSYRIKPPLISVLPLPIYAVIGAGERAALWVHEICLALTLWLVYRIGKELYGEDAGAAAAASAALLPILYGLSRVYLVETPLTCAVAAAQLAFLRSRKNGPRHGLILGLILGLGMLLKVIFPLYLLGTAWLLRRELRVHAKTAILTGAAVASTWYLFNLPYMAGWTWSTSFGSVAADYGSKSIFSAAVWWAYIMRVGRDLFSGTYIVSAAALLAWAAARRREPFKWGEAETLLAAWFLIPAAVCTLGINKEIRYLAPAAPAVAVAVGAAAARLWGGPASGLLAAGLLSAPLAVFGTQTFGRPAGPPLSFNGPPTRDPGWARGAFLDALEKLAVANGEPPDGGPPPIVAIGIEHRRFNANNLSSLAALRRLKWRFINLGYSARTREAVLIRLRDKGARYIVMVRGVPRGDVAEFLNRANDGIQDWLDRGVIRNAVLGDVPLTPGVTATVYRIQP